MNGKELRASLRSGRRVFGTLIVSESPRWPKAIENVGLDFVFIDTEHTSLDNSQVAWMCQVYSNMGLAPLVRIPGPDPYKAANVIDIGAEGVIVPYVESAQQVEDLRGALRIRPLKGRRLQETLAGEKMEPELAAYLEERNANHVMVVNIESVPAMENLDEILAVPGLDAILIGPHDLSCSLGIPEQYDHPRFIAATTEIFQKARAQNVGAGIHSMGSIEHQAAFVQTGANMLIHSADILLFSNALRDDLAAIRTAVGEDTNPNAETDVHI